MRWDRGAWEVTNMTETELHDFLEACTAEIKQAIIDMNDYVGIGNMLSAKYCAETIHDQAEMIEDAIKANGGTNGRTAR